MRLLTQMDNQGKTEESSGRQRRHCFPDLIDHQSDRRSDAGDGCTRFKPLYPIDGDASKSLVSCEFSGESPSDTAEAQDMALQLRYRQGFDAGQQDACSMVQKDLEPHLVHFESALETMSGDMERVLSSAGDAIYSLASAIAAKILCQPMEKDDGDIHDVTSHLQSALLSAYRLELRLNPEEFELLNHLTRKRTLVGEQNPYVPVTSDDEIQKGTLEQRHQVLPLTEEQVDAILNNAEPSQP